MCGNLKLRAVWCCVHTHRRLHGNRYCLKAKPLKNIYSVVHSAKPEEDHHELHHVELEGAGEEKYFQPVTGVDSVTAAGFLSARLQSFVLVLKLLDKMADLLFAVPVGWDEI